MTSSQKSVLPSYETDNSQASKLIRKSKESPFVPVGKFQFHSAMMLWSKTSKSGKIHGCISVHVMGGDYNKCSHSLRTGNYCEMLLPHSV